MSTSLLVKFRHFAPSIWQQTVRHRGKFNFKMPKPRHEIARHLEEITKPVLIREIPDPVETCVEAKLRIAKKMKFSTSDAIDFERFLASHAFKLMEESETMLICHKLDCPGETFRRNKIEFKKTETSLWNFNTVIMKLLIEENAKYKNLYPIVNSGLGRNFYLFFPEKHLKKNLQLLKKMPHLVLLGGMIQKTLLTKAGIQNYAQMESIDTLRGQLCATLSHQLSLINRTLSSPTISLLQSLEQHTKPESKQ